jgi:fibro-slime domain-containing protein
VAMLCAACAAGGGEGTETSVQSGRPAGGGSSGTTPSLTTGGGTITAEEGPMFNPDDLVATDECDGKLAVVYRDFNDSHPDFEMDFRGDVVRRQLVQRDLGADGKPVFASSVGCPAQNGTPTACANWNVSQPVITSADSFNQWYRDTTNINVAFEKTLELIETPPASGFYKFSSTDFFPIGNGEGFGITPPGQSRNFLFTTEVHVTFQYVAGSRFTFRGDDDMWIFVNKRLALDLGSMHGVEEGVINFDAQAEDLGIAPGRAYPMDIFHAERHTSASNFSVETNIACFTAIAPR